MSFDGGSYGLFGTVSGRLTCGGGVTGATLTPGASDSGCILGDGPTVAGALILAADTATGTGTGSGSGSGSNQDKCDQLVAAAGMWSVVAQFALDAGDVVNAGLATGREEGLIDAANILCPTSPP
jgi:hypothetical protein